MSYMQPQAPKLNQRTWKYLEDYTREIVNKNTEAYVYSGCYGEAGRIKNKITTPTRCWKIVVALPVGDNDLKRINAKTHIIAVDAPNEESVSSRWRTYLTSVDAIEKATGYDFLASVPKRTQAVIEAVIDKVSDSPEKTTVETPSVEPTGAKPASGDREYIIGPRGGCCYITSSGKETYVGKDKCN